MHPGFCPRCGERVSPYAAGCAMCGAELDPQRWHTPPTLGQRMTWFVTRHFRRRPGLRIRP